MIRKLYVGITVLFLLPSLCHALQIEGIEMPDRMVSASEQLKLNGAGVRSKFFLDLYVGGLYLKQKSNDPEKIIRADEPMAIRLHIISSLITSEKMEKATREGFENAAGENISAISSQIETFISVFKEEISEGDIYDMIYIPGMGVTVAKNGEVKSTITGMEFKKALFGIWLSKKPAQDSLKREMLGR